MVEVNEELAKKYENQLQAAKIDSAANQIARHQQQMMMQPEEKSIAKEQLDLSEEIARIDYLLKGYSLEPAEGGKLKWVKPDDPDMVIFTDYGIHLIRNTICWYLNKNLLLSNFDDVTIRKKMWDFTNDLIDTLSAEYDKIFIQPTVEQCIEVLKQRVAKQTEITAYSREIAGLDVDKEEIYNEKFDAIEDKIEEEIEKIRQNTIKSKLKRILLTVRVIQDAVHATFNRAYKGEERRSLREHMHVSETRGNGMLINPQKTGGFWPWGKK